MTIVELLILFAIAAIVGSVAQALAGFYVGGCLVSIVVGFIGAFIGSWLARELNLPELLVINIDGESFPIIWSIIGGAIFAAILGFLMPARRVDVV